jgi:hypothetical protein
MALKAPATYWETRGQSSRTVAALAFGGFVLAIIILFLIVKENYITVKGWIVGQDGRIDPTVLVVLSPIIVLLLWFFRMIARLYNIAIAESVDAGQRRVMVTTFLSIMNDPNIKLSDAERFLILQALFRASGGKDEPDTMPSNMLEALTKAAQGKV